MLGTWDGLMYWKVLPTLPCRGMLSMTFRPSSMKEEHTLRFEGSSRSNLGDFRVSGKLHPGRSGQFFPLHHDTCEIIDASHSVLGWPV
jgi:hypothetical protein